MLLYLCVFFLSHEINDENIFLSIFPPDFALMWSQRNIHFTVLIQELLPDRSWNSVTTDIHRHPIPHPCYPLQTLLQAMLQKDAKLNHVMEILASLFTTWVVMVLARWLAFLLGKFFFKEKFQHCTFKTECISIWSFSRSDPYFVAF